MDTNALDFNCALSTIGVSVKYNYDINSTFVTRRAKEKIGALWKLTVSFILLSILLLSID